MAIISFSIIIQIHVKEEPANLRAVGSGKAATPGALFEIDKDTLKSLDQKEGVKLPHCYKRIKVTAFTENGEGFECYTYIHYPDSLDYYPPTKEYETLIRDGLIKLSLPVNSLDCALQKYYKFWNKILFCLWDINEKSNQAICNAK